MYRDFSAKSKQTLLGLVSDVESSNLCAFTDWNGDQWYKFESWIGALDIRKYVDKVNNYHRKVLDKNNTSKQTIENIFSSVTLLDVKYADKFGNINFSLQQRARYIEQLAMIVAPENGKFSSTFMNRTLAMTLKLMDREPITPFKDGIPDLRGDNMLDHFLETRNTVKDAILFALTRDITEGLDSALKKLFGKDDMTDDAIKGSINSILKRLDSNRLDTSTAQEAISDSKLVVGTFKTSTELAQKIMEGDKETMLYLKMDQEVFDGLGDLLKGSKEAVKLAETLINDYTKRLDDLKKMRAGLLAVNADPEVIKYCDQMIIEYNSDIERVLDQAMDYATGNFNDAMIAYLEEIYSGTTGGLIGVSLAAHDTIWTIFGLQDDGDALAAVYASSKYSESLIESYELYAEKVRSGNYTEEDLVMCKEMFELAKAAKIEELENLKEITKAMYHDEIDREIERLSLMEWDNSYSEP